MQAITQTAPEKQGSIADLETVRIKNMATMLKNYEDEIDKLAASQEVPARDDGRSTNPETVLLTG